MPLPHVVDAVPIHLATDLLLAHRTSPSACSDPVEFESPDLEGSYRWECPSENLLYICENRRIRSRIFEISKIFMRLIVFLSAFFMVKKILVSYEKNPPTFLFL